jgi:hypothetical protein
VTEEGLRRALISRLCWVTDAVSFKRRILRPAIFTAGRYAGSLCSVIRSLVSRVRLASTRVAELEEQKANIAGSPS